MWNTFQFRSCHKRYTIAAKHLLLDLARPHAGLLAKQLGRSHMQKEGDLWFLYASGRVDNSHHQSAPSIAHSCSLVRHLFLKASHKINWCLGKISTLHTSCVQGATSLLPLRDVYPFLTVYSLSPWKEHCPAASQMSKDSMASLILSKDFQFHVSPSLLLSIHFPNRVHFLDISYGSV
ncbi:hypothetical protein Dimus_015388 [Dionaea muscipula]